MNYLVYLDPQNSELEKILSGTKSMLVKEFNPARSNVGPLKCGDNLYFLRSKADSTLRVKATVIRTISFTHQGDEELSQVLKEYQPRLQFSEEQYNFWSTQGRLLFVEFASAQKINPIQIASQVVTDHTDWFAFEDFSSIT